MPWERQELYFAKLNLLGYPMLENLNVQTVQHETKTWKSTLTIIAVFDV